MPIKLRNLEWVPGNEAAPVSNKGIKFDTEEGKEII